MEAAGTIIDMTSQQEPTPGPWDAWRAAAADPAIDCAIAALYEGLDAAVRQRGPVCWASGRCCNFNSYGHLLYVTGLEIAWFLSKLPPDRHDWRGRLEVKGACPFQVNSLCTTHATRPLGCRIYFCQRGTESWQHEVYEQFQQRLRMLHDAHALPYQYMEWRAGLSEGA